MLDKLRNSKNFKRTLVSLLACFNLVVLGGTGFAVINHISPVEEIKIPSAGFGYGDSVSHGGTGSAASYIAIWAYDDYKNPPQGWGQASIDYFYNQINVNQLPGGYTSMYDIVRTRINEECSEAINNAIANTPGATKARVVQMGFAYGPSETNPSRLVTRGATSTFWVNVYDSLRPAVEASLINWPAGLESQAISGFRNRMASNNNLSVFCQAYTDVDVDLFKPTPPLINKYWADTEEQAKTIDDAGRNPQGGIGNNNVGADQKTFYPGDEMWIGLHARLYKQEKPHTSLYIQDWDGDVTNHGIQIDWSRAKVWHRYGDAGTWYDASELFTYWRGTGNTESDNPSLHRWTAKDGYLSRHNNSQDLNIKIVAPAKAVKSGTAGQVQKAINHVGLRWETAGYGGAWIDGNQPWIFVVWDRPNKAWVNNLDEAKSTNDPNWTNNVALDNHYVVPEQTVGVVVNQPIPTNLSRGVQNVTLTDDLTGSVDYVTWDESTIKVLFNGSDITDKFTTSLVETTADDGTKTLKVSAESKSDSKINEMTDNLTIAGMFKLYIEGTVKTDGFEINTVYTMPNAGKTKVNEIELDTNEPVIKLILQNPKKDVVQAVDSASIDNGEIAYQDDFFYKLESSRLDKDFGESLETWVLTDDFDETQDQLTGQFQILDPEGKDITNAFKFSVLTESGILDNILGGGEDWQDITEGMSTDSAAEDISNVASVDLTKVTQFKIELTDKTVFNGMEAPYFIAFVGMKRIAKPAEVVNGTTECINGICHDSNEVKTTTPDNKPEKDVTQDLNGDSINTGEIPMGGKAWYKLETGDRLVASGSAMAKSWSVFDDFDQEFDRVTGKASIFADFDLGDKIKAGQDITNMFNIEFLSDSDQKVASWDASKIRFEARGDLIELLNQAAEESETKTIKFAWTANFEFERLKGVDKLINTFTENYNGEDYLSNEVWTHTPPPGLPPSGGITRSVVNIVAASGLTVVAGYALLSGGRWAFLARLFRR